MTYLDTIAMLIRDSLPEGTQPPDASESLFRFYSVLARAKGEAVTAEDVHDTWAAWMQTVNQDHAALVPFDELEPEVREEDIPYLKAIQKAARILREVRDSR